MSEAAAAGKRIFITGGASGLGRALAERYARAGWRVCIGDLDVERCADALAAIRVHSPHSQALACDVTREDALQAAAEWLQREWGGVDVVVNNAGVAQMGGIAETTLDDWRWAVDINLLGVVRGCKVFAPLLRTQGGGQLVNIASMAGLVHMPQAAAYNATKAAVVTLFRLLKHRQVSVLILLLGPRRAVDALKLLVTVVTAPIGSGDFHQLEYFQLARGRDVGSPAEVDEITFPVKRYFLPFRDCGDQFGFVMLAD